MNNVIKAMANKMSAQIIRDMVADPKNPLFQEVFAAYNAWQEDEKDGCDYFFNINNRDDLMCCIKCGMTASEIAFIYNKVQNGCTPIFLFGYNHPEPHVYESWNFVRNDIAYFIEEICYNVVAYPYVEAYRPLYTRYVTDTFIDNINSFI